MVKFAASIVYGSALVASVLAAPRPDSAIGGEVAVSAPNGTPITDTAELASQTAAEAASSLAAAYATSSASSDSSSYGSNSNSYGSDSSMDSSYGSSDSSSMDSSYGSSDSSSMDSSYGSYDTSSMDSSYGSYDTMSMDNSYTDTMSTDMSYSTSTVENYYTSTMSTYESTSTTVYGSGSSSWNSGSYDSCVQQCVAEFGMPMGSYSPPTSTSDSSSDSSDSGSSGSGATHTIIVAPSQGVLRFVPFATNASVGDTIKFYWGANMHTVTHSSQFSPCNKTETDPFTSGVQNKSFVFTQVVNDTNPLFFYCGVPTHCQKGMFGIVNPPSALSADTSIMSSIPSMIMNNSNIAAMAAYQQNLTSNNSGAASWGSAINMANMTSDQMTLMAENVMYTRTFLAANPEIVDSTGAVDLSKATGPYMVPQDISLIMASAKDSSSTASGASSSAASGTDSSASTTPTSGASKSGASMMLVGTVALAALFAL